MATMAQAVMEAVDCKYRYRFVVPEEVTLEQWERARGQVEAEIRKVMDSRKLDLEDYEENKQHILIDETCKRLGLDSYTRYKNKK